MQERGDKHEPGSDNRTDDQYDNDYVAWAKLQLLVMFCF